MGRSDIPGVRTQGSQVRTDALYHSSKKPFLAEYTTWCTLVKFSKRDPHEYEVFSSQVPCMYRAHVDPCFNGQKGSQMSNICVCVCVCQK